MTIKHANNFIDLTGLKFGHLTVVKQGENYVSPNGKKTARWWCVCDCQLHKPEEERELVLYRSNVLKSCKNIRCSKCRHKSSYIDLSGYKFGKLTVIKKVHRPEHLKQNGTYWLCQCECGNTTIMITADINRRSKLSCGHCPKNIFNLSSKEYGIGYTSNDEPFYFDKEDYDLIKKYNWSKISSGYIMAWDKKRESFIYMHRLVTGVIDKPEFEVDHKKHIRHDNRKQELRVCSRTENGRNLSIAKNNTSGVTGVWWSNSMNKWSSSIMVNHKTINLGYYVNFEDAVKVRKEAEEKYFGEFSYDNSMKRRI